MKSLRFRIVPKVVYLYFTFISLTLHFNYLSEILYHVCAQTVILY